MKLGQGDQSVSAAKFLELMAELRKVFIQDAPFFRQRHPNHLIWSYELFNTPEWEDWERRMLAVVQAPTLVRNYALEEAAPEMFEWLRSNISPLTAQVETAIRQAQQHQNDVVPRLATLETAVQQLSSVMATVCTAVARIEGSQYEKAQHRYERDYTTLADSRAELLSLSEHPLTSATTTELTCGNLQVARHLPCDLTGTDSGALHSHSSGPPAIRPTRRQDRRSASVLLCSRACSITMATGNDGCGGARDSGAQPSSASSSSSHSEHGHRSALMGVIPGRASRDVCRRHGSRQWAALACQQLGGRRPPVPAPSRQGAAARPAPAADVPRKKEGLLRRNKPTVADHWHEYQHGWNSGPPIRLAYDVPDPTTWEAKFLVNNKAEQMQWLRTNRVLNVIKKLASASSIPGQAYEARCAEVAFALDDWCARRGPLWLKQQDGDARRAIEELGLAAAKRITPIKLSEITDATRGALAREALRELSRAVAPATTSTSFYGA